MKHYVVWFRGQTTGFFIEEDTATSLVEILLELDEATCEERDGPIPWGDSTAEVCESMLRMTAAIREVMDAREAEEAEVADDDEPAPMFSYVAELCPPCPVFRLHAVPSIGGQS